jgi:hypothetical protein
MFILREAPVHDSNQGDQHAIPRRILCTSLVKGVVPDVFLWGDA